MNENLLHKCAEKLFRERLEQENLNPETVDVQKLAKQLPWYRINSEQQVVQAVEQSIAKLKKELQIK